MAESALDPLGVAAIAASGPRFPEGRDELDPVVEELPDGNVAFTGAFCSSIWATSLASSLWATLRLQGWSG
jgi:hypothetical protein